MKEKKTKTLIIPLNPHFPSKNKKIPNARIKMAHR